MSGLLFGVTPDVGMELLLREPIFTCFLTRNTNELTKLRDLHGIALEIELKAHQSRWMIDRYTEPKHQERVIFVFCSYVQAWEFSNHSNFIEPCCEAMKEQFIKWAISEYDFVTSYKLLLKHSSQTDQHYQWLIDNVHVLVDQIIAELDQEERNENLSLQLSSIVDYLSQVGATLTPYIPKHLPIQAWRQWLVIREENLINKMPDIAPLLTPPENSLINLIEAIDLGEENLDPGYLTALHSTVDLFPSESQIWKRLTGLLVQWLQIHRGHSNLPELYRLVFVLLENLEVQDSIDLVSEVKKKDFWLDIQSAETDILAYLALLFVNRDNDFTLPPNQYVNNFWSDEQDQKTCDQSLGAVESLALRDSIFWLAKNGQKHAMQLINQNRVSRILRSPEGARYVDNMAEYLEESELAALVNNLVNQGSLAAIKSDIAEEIFEYREVIFIFKTYGDSKSRAPLKEILKNADRTTWDELLDWLVSKEDASEERLIEFIPSKGDGFTESYKSSLIQIVSRTRDNSDTRYLKLLSGLKPKLLSFETTFSTDLLRAYFGQKTDNLTDQEFEMFLPPLVQALGAVGRAEFENRFLLWLDSERPLRIATTLSTKVKDISIFGSSRLEHFRTRLADQIEHHSSPDESAEYAKNLKRIASMLKQVTREADTL